MTDRFEPVRQAQQAQQERMERDPDYFPGYSVKVPDYFPSQHDQAETLSRTLDINRSSEIKIDSQREITVTPSSDRQSVVLLVEDPHSIAVVEMTIPDVDALIEALERATR